MTIFNLFSKRQNDASKSGKADVYQYTDIPANLRVQVKQIAIDAIGFVGVHGDGMMRGKEENVWWAQIERVFLREKGLEGIGHDAFSGSRILSYMRDCSTADWLDLLELIALGIKIMGADDQAHQRQRWEVATTAEKAMEEINYRLRQAGVGYQIEDGQLIRVDSQFVHAEVVKPALALLSNQGFDGPRQEFLAAHQHYRAGEHRQAVAMAANALESTFKAIFDKKGWSYQKGSRISDLVKVARANGLWPDYLDASFDQLLATIQSGLPKIRDNDASHGQGATTRDVPGYIAAYALHLAASKIVFIAEAAK
ncbi:STM4504/CBY_0614 family protein [Sphingopyxis sp.]|uniref:STM4504/CBY_0614 family protein n=1 Tax=Sphingopyxis sp. TaxID=1908224 RepID=UPI002FC64AD1